MKCNQDHNALVLGIANEEYYSHVEVLRGSIKQTKRDQKNIGEHILKTYGFDTVKNEYSISTDGTVLKLVVIQGKAKYVEAELEKEK